MSGASTGPRDDDMRAYRRAHFAVKIERVMPPYEPGEIRLAITTNGSQWQSIALTPIELLAVIRALLLYEA